MLANNTRSIDFKLAELSAKLSSPYPTSTTAPPTPATRRLPTAEARKSAELRQPGHTPASQLPTKSSLVNSGVATAPKPSQPSFQPSKCIVISSTNTNKEHMTSIDQDELRKTISKNHGPLIIDSIRRYKFRTENPRFMVQLGSAEDVTKVTADWYSDAFGGTSVRATILPTEIPTGMIRGVPLDLNTDTIRNAITTKYPDVTVYRLTKENNPLCTVKISFASTTDLSDALKNGITIDDYNMRFRVELPYNADKTTPQNGFES